MAPEDLARVVENLDLPIVDPHRHRARGGGRQRGVVRRDHLHEAGIIDRARALGEVAHARGRQRPKVRSLLLIQLEMMHEWPHIQEYARRLDANDASVRLVEFVDYECAACRQFHEVSLPALRAHFRESLGVSVVHFPLRSHRFARAAGQAAECAADQGRFDEYGNQLFAAQDSIGVKSWAEFATAAGVGDTVIFKACLARASSLALVDSSAALARRIGIKPTPTIIVNGWHVPEPSVEELTRVITSLLASQVPYHD